MTLASPLLLRCLHAGLRDCGDAAARFASQVLAPTVDLYRPIDVQQVERAFSLAAALAPDPALPLQAGRELAPHTLGMLGLLLAEARTFGAALAELQRFLPLLGARARCELSMASDGARLRVHLPIESTSAQRVAYEFAFAFLLQLARSFVGHAACPRQVSFPYAAPDHRAQYEQCFGCALHFGERAELDFPTAWLDVPRPLADQVLLQLLRPEADARLAQVARSTPMRKRVHTLLTTRPDLTEGDANEVAKLLGTSRSKMRRALRDEGETLLAIADEVRIERARSLLANRELSVKAISEQLGYSQPSAFHRAFKRKTGLSPSQFRR